MEKTFYNCKSLYELDLDSFYTNNLINMKQMFYGCENLTNLFLTNFNTEKCNNFFESFEGCYNLTIFLNKTQCQNMINSLPNYVNISELI